MSPILISLISITIFLFCLAATLFFILRHVKKKFSGYNQLIRILRNIKGNHTNFMNFGYWNKQTETLSKANMNLCDYILKKANLTDSKKILDVGCGYGEQDFYIHSKIQKPIYCLDISEKQIMEFRDCIKSKKLKKMLKAVIGDATQLPFTDKKFDTILSIESAFHYKPRTKFFQEAARVLKKKGTLVIADILLHEDKKQTTIPMKLCQNFFDVPNENLIDKYVWKKQLEAEGFHVELYDITNNTFIPYFNYFIENFSFDNFLYNFFSSSITSYIKNKQPFVYVVAVATKE